MIYLGQPAGYKDIASIASQMGEFSLVLLLYSMKPTFHAALMANSNPLQN